MYECICIYTIYMYILHFAMSFDQYIILLGENKLNLNI